MRALVVGSSAGIGLAVARRLVAAGWTVIGVARRPAPIDDPSYRHVLADVRATDYRDVLREVGPVDTCIYATGVGHVLDVADLSTELDSFRTNLDGMVATAEVVLPAMIAARAGHFVGLSSQADRVIDDRAPSYAASKAGMSMYLEALALALRPQGVAVTNVRFGFVDTEMSKATSPRPFLITAERAAILVERCLARRPIRFTYPWRMAAALWLVMLPRRLRIWLS